MTFSSGRGLDVSHSLGAQSGQNTMGNSAEAGTLFSRAQWSDSDWEILDQTLFSEELEPSSGLATNPVFLGGLWSVSRP